MLKRQLKLSTGIFMVIQDVFFGWWQLIFDSYQYMFNFLDDGYDEFMLDSDTTIAMCIVRCMGNGFYSNSNTIYYNNYSGKNYITIAGIQGNWETIWDDNNGDNVCLQFYFLSILYSF